MYKSNPEKSSIEQMVIAKPDIVSLKLQPYVIIILKFLLEVVALVDLTALIIRNSTMYQ